MCHNDQHRRRRLQRAVDIQYITNITRKSLNPPYTLWELGIFGDNLFCVLDWFPHPLRGMDSSQSNLIEISNIHVFNESPRWLQKPRFISATFSDVVCNKKCYINRWKLTNHNFVCFDCWYFRFDFDVKYVRSVTRLLLRLRVSKVVSVLYNNNNSSTAEPVYEIPLPYSY